VVVGEVPTGTDVLVVGGGPGGYAAALRAASLGRSVTLVERARLGGVCLNVGCIPSKALIHAADLADSAATAADFGVKMTASVDMGAVQSWIGGVVERLTGGIGQLLRARGVTVVEGTARLTAPRRAAVWSEPGPRTGGEGRSRFIEFGSVIVATGSRPVDLPDLPVDGERVLDSTGALRLDRIPPRLVVVGGGYIGVELGTAFAKLGSEVTIVELGPRLLPGLPEDLVGVVERGLRRRGVGIRTRTRAHGFDGDALVVAGPEGEARLPADVAIVAVGRRPNTDGLGLELAGVHPGPDGLIHVAPDRRAGRGVYAIGDVTPGLPLAHKATAEAEVAGAAVAGRPGRFEPMAVPAVVFSDPEVVSVGMTVEQATEAGADVDSFRFPLAASGRALTLGRPEGHAQVVADRQDGVVLGVHLVGAGVSELAAGAALAVEMQAQAEDLALTIAPHPTVSEAIAEAAKGLTGQPLHVTGAS
jgi:dihydrolipoamide dehydrogenase